MEKQDLTESLSICDREKNNFISQLRKREIYQSSDSKRNIQIFPILVTFLISWAIIGGVVEAKKYFSSSILEKDAIVSHNFLKQSHTIIIVSQGESLVDIAHNYAPDLPVNAVVQEIVKINKLPNFSVYPGEKLCLPDI